MSTLPLHEAAPAPGWQFDAAGSMSWREAGINYVRIDEDERRIRGARPDELPLR